MKEIDLAKEENLFSFNKIKMGFSAKDIVNKLKQKDLVTITETNAFKEVAQWFIISMLAKLFEKSALGSTLVCDLPREKLSERWK